MPESAHVFCGELQHLDKHAETIKRGRLHDGSEAQNRKMGAFSVVYWLILTAIYLAWSFSTNTWDKTWIVYVVGGVIYAALCVVWELVMNRENRTHALYAPSHKDVRA